MKLDTLKSSRVTYNGLINNQFLDMIYYLIIFNDLGYVIFNNLNLLRFIDKIF